MDFSVHVSNFILQSTVIFFTQKVGLRNTQFCIVGLERLIGFAADGGFGNFTDGVVDLRYLAKLGF